MLIAAVIAELLADYALKRWTIPGSGPAWAWAGALGYALSGLAWGVYLKTTTLHRGIVVFAAANLLGAVGIGILAFHERPTLRAITACVLALAAILLVEEP